MRTILFLSCLVLVTLANAEKKLPQSLVVAPGTPELTDTFNQEAAKVLLDKGIEELVFIKRYTLNANHYYSEYVNSKWMPGGNLCVLNLKTGKVRELVPEFNSGVFNRFDISFDAKRVLFDYKESGVEGYRIYEVNIDGSGLRQITFPTKAEQELIDSYHLQNYHHGTDDLHPIYLPDGGIAFVSTRCQRGILCDAKDLFTTKVLYRMDMDGSNMQPLSFNPVSEAAPTLMPDGRILYNRWEYNDKAAGNAKCLWAMRPDGSGTVEIYGNTLTQPETLIYARSIPGSPNKVVSLATSHCCPNNGMGTVIIIDTTKNIRTREPLSYVTKDVDMQHHNGFHFLIDGEWVHDKTGRPGRLLKDPYPISEDLFIVSQKPKGYSWDHPHAYDLFVLDGEGNDTPLFTDKSISCWHPYPLVPRPVPPVSRAPLNAELAKANKAECIVTDVYVGMPGVERGTIKYLRIMEQIGRPWAARNRWVGDKNGMAHSAVGIGRLGVKVQYGIVPVEEDGSAYFQVPADRNIYFQALDENYMAVQTERTYINYRPGETRSCIGCHETPGATPVAARHHVAAALKRPPSKPMPQPGDSRPEKVIDFMTQVQPVLDSHCVECHGSVDPEGGLELTGTETDLFTVSYEQLMRGKNDMGVPYIGEYESANEDRGSADISYREAYHSGSHTSPIATILSNGRVPLRNPNGEEITRRLVAAHEDISVTQEEFINVVNWLDSFGQFYPSYWGIKHKAFDDNPFYRPVVSFEQAVNPEAPNEFADLYTNPPEQVEIPERKKL
ncbi:MAG: hypothetical protein AB3N63_11745 [Puniceicoccaceae bacterium]